jgi:hypothetical protein
MNMRHLTNAVPWATVAAIVLLIAASVMLMGWRPQIAPAVATAAPQSMDDYANLRRMVEARLPSPRVTADVDELRGRGDALGVAMQAASPHARQGRAFTAATADHIRTLIQEDMMRRSISERAGIMREVPSQAPAVNARYPVEQGLATMPPRLLQLLPRLPVDLEYRLMGRDLIIRDDRTNLIVDYVTGVT